MASNKASRASRQSHGRGSFLTGWRNARHQNQASTAYSVACAVLRTRKIILPKTTAGISGQKNFRKGSIKREVCATDLPSPEAEKMSAIQISNGSQ